MPPPHTFAIIYIIFLILLLFYLLLFKYNHPLEIPCLTVLEPGADLDWNMGGLFFGSSQLTTM